MERMKMIEQQISVETFKNYLVTGDIEGVKKGIEQGINPSVEDNLPIRITSVHRDIEIVKLLLQDERVDPSAKNNHAIEIASEKGDIEIVRMLSTDRRYRNQ